MDIEKRELHHTVEIFEQGRRKWEGRSQSERQTPTQRYIEAAQEVEKASHRLSANIFFQGWRSWERPGSTSSTRLGDLLELDRTTEALIRAYVACYGTEFLSEEAE